MNTSKTVSSAIGPEQAPPSPCRGICRLDPKGGQCVGCLRTVEEIAAWPTIGARAKQDVLDALARRRQGAEARIALPANPGGKDLPRIVVLERGWVSSNNILVIGERDTAVIDTGYGLHAAQTLALVRRALDGRALDHIVITHAHSDHMGGTAALKRAYPQARIHIPAGERQVIGAWDTQALRLGPGGHDCERFAFDATYQAGDVLELGGLEWRVVGSPGHDMDSLMLYCASRGVLVSADALWEHGFGILIPELSGEIAAGEAQAAQRATLREIARLDISQVIPGHGAPFGDAGPALARAHLLLDNLAADFTRGARAAVNGAMTFMLRLERRLRIAELPRTAAALPLVEDIRRHHLFCSREELADGITADLVRTGIAVREGEWLRAA